MTSDPTRAARPSRFGTRDLVATFGRDRTCADDQCSTVLSRYNKQDRCGIHEGESEKAVAPPRQSQ